jgi:hypothetical protein
MVRYRTNTSNSTIFSNYYKFIDYIQTLFLHNYAGFIEEFNKFRTILIDADNHTWRVYEEEREGADFNELLALNESEKEEKPSIAKRARESVKRFNKKKIKDIVDKDKYDIRNSYR